MKTIRNLLGLCLLLLIAVVTFVYSGMYPVGADTPHYRISYLLLQTLREQSIQRASRDIAVPALDNSEWLLSGGADYHDMCAGCHLQPGVEQSDLSIGLYPSPPKLTQQQSEADSKAVARRQFWIIKHGIKASGMPAWGPTHDDQRIWAMVAFLQQLPRLTPLQYQILTARGESETNHH